MTGRLRTAVAAALLALGAGQGLAAGDKASLLDWIGARIDAEDAVLAPARIEPVWIDGDRLLIPDARGGLAIDLVDARTGSRRAVSEPAALAAALRASGLDPARFRPRGLDASGLQLSDGSHWFRLDKGSLAPAPDLELRARREVPQWIASQFPTTFDDLVELPAPDGSRFLTLQGHDLALRVRDGTVTALTQGATPELTWRSSEESEQDFPAVWSPDGKLIAAVRLDLRGVPHEPVVRWLETPPRVDRIPYPRAGKPMPRFAVALISPEGSVPRFLDLGETADHYVNIIDFSRDGRTLLVQVIDRAHHHWRLLGVEVASGAARTLLEERRATYIDTPMTLGPILVRAVDGGFLHLSEASGTRHIVLHAPDGRKLRALTSGPFAVEDIAAIDHRGGWVYFLADTRPSTVLKPRLYRVRLTGGRIEAIGGEGVEKLWFAPGYRHVVMRRSTTTAPPVTELVSLDGRASVTLSRPVSPQLAALPRGIPISAPSTDGRREVHGVLYLPPGTEGPVPIVEIIYGGMQLDFMPRHWFGFGRLEGGYNGMIARLLLSRGYAVGYINAPGTPGRGRDYQDATYGTWPQSVIADHVAWWRAAAGQHSVLDLDRLGVFGNSWGGYLAQRAMIDAPGFYRAAVAMAPPSDFVDHPNYIEPFMGTPAENPQGYKAASNLARVGQIAGPVLVMPMPLDVNAGFSPAMKFVNAMILAGKNVEIFTMPEVNHRVNCCGPERERYAYATVIDFLDRKLHD
ncbi:DPP IV N-terminal domain-containing protein [Erythrobacter sp. NE805]|uniref:S9 family peptidase n=1 Tax=Erythrobacter sp. NE805 TaxID=3389875 RepID=UPI00396B19D0